MHNNINIIKKRQFILWICCLCLLLGIIIGAVIAIKNDMAISFLSFNGSAAKLQSASYLKLFFNTFKYTAVAFAAGAIAETHILTYFLIFYKGFSLGYTAFSIAETGILKRLAATALYLPPELIICTYIIFTAVYFSSALPISAGERGYKLEKKRRVAELIILLLAAFGCAAVCAGWKSSTASAIFNLL